MRITLHLLSHLAGLRFSQKRARIGVVSLSSGGNRGLIKLDLLVDIFHRDGHWFVQLLYHLVSLLQLALDPTNRQLEKLVLAL